MGPSLTPQDRKAGLQGRSEGGRFVAVYDPALGLEICERVANGELLKDFMVKGSKYPHRATFARWVANNPDLAKAFNAALQLSAASFEEEAIAMARQIKTAQKNGTQVRAFEVAMNQLRWSATRRDPARYGERANTVVRVPIQINTTLDLGDDTAGGTTEHPNIYGLEARVTTEVTPGGDKPLVGPDHIQRSKKGKLILKPRVATPTSTSTAGDT